MTYPIHSLEDFTVRCGSIDSTIAGKSHYPPFFNVRDYGAVGDGTTDDTTSILNAYAAACVKGGVVWFPSGNYRMTAVFPLNTYHTAVRFMGPDPYSANIWFTPTTGNLISFG